MPTLRLSNPSPHRPAANGALGVLRGPILLGGAFIAAPLAAQSSGRVDVTGHVAPRCWTLQAVTPDQAVVMSHDSRTSIAARCNHSATPISVQVRQPNRTVSPAQLPAEDIAASRPAIEIVLSPTL